MKNVQDVPASHFQQASQWEASRVISAERSERRAWMTAGAMGIGLLLSLATIVVMAPLKQTVPYVVRVDNATGVPDIVTAMTDQVLTGDDVMDKYWLAKYVTHRETYDWQTLQTDYDTVGVMSSALVGSEYEQYFSGEDALQEQYKDRVKANIEIVSVVPNGGNVGTIRFIKTTKRTRPGSSRDVTRWVATVAFEYQNTGAMMETVRLVNPFGFRVTSYRVDPELVGG